MAAFASNTIRFECEDPAVFKDSFANGANRPVDNFASEIASKGAVHIIRNAGTDGGWAEFNIASPSADSYIVRIGVVQFANAGTFKVLVNGETLGPVFEGYAAADTAAVFNAGTVNLKEGTNLVRIEMVGRNAAAGNNNLRLDYIEIVPASGGNAATGDPGLIIPIALFLLCGTVAFLLLKRTGKITR